MTPSCFASSWTRSFPDTALLTSGGRAAPGDGSVRAPGAPAGLPLYVLPFIADASSCAHQCLGLSVLIFPVSLLIEVHSSRGIRRFRGIVCGDKLFNRKRVYLCRHLQCAAKCSTPVCCFPGFQGRCNPGTSTLHLPIRVRHDGNRSIWAGSCDNAQQLRTVAALLRCDTSTRGCMSSRIRVYNPRCRHTLDAPTFLRCISA